MSIWIVTQKAKLSVRNGFSAIQCSEKPEREKVSGGVWDNLCSGVKWSVWLYVKQKWLSVLKLRSNSYLTSYLGLCYTGEFCIIRMTFQ